MADERREVVAVITADSKDLQAELGRASSRVRAGGKRIGQELKVSIKQGFGSLTDIIGIGGAAGLMAAGKQVFDFQKRLTRLQISSGKSRGEIMRLEESLFRVAKQKGLDPDSILGGAEKFTEKTGNLKAFIDSIDKLGSVGAGTGAELADIAGVTAALNMSLGISSVEDVGAAWDVIAAGANKGSVEVKNFATLLSGLAPQAALFGGKGVQAAADLSAFLQMTATGFGSADEAATGLRAIMETLIGRSKELKKQKFGGIDVYGKDGKSMRSLRDIIFDIGNSKLMSKPSLLKEALGGRGEALRGLLAIFQEINGVGAKERFDSLADVADSMGTIDKQSQIWENSPAGQMATAQAKLAEVFNDQFKNNLDEIASAMSSMAGALSFASKHAELVVAALAAAKFGPDMGDFIDWATGGGAGGGGGGGAGGGRGRGRGKGKSRMPDGGGTGAILGLGAGIAAGNWINDATEDLTGRSLSSWGAGAADAIIPASTFFGGGDYAAQARDAAFGTSRGTTTNRLIAAQERAAMDSRRLGGIDLIGDPTLPGAGIATDAQNNLQSVNAKVMAALADGLDSALAKSMWSDIDSGIASRGRAGAVTSEGQAALQAAIAGTGSASFFDANPDALASLTNSAMSAAGSNPLLGSGEAGLMMVIAELTREIRALRSGADARAVLGGGAYGDANSSVGGVSGRD